MHVPSGLTRKKSSLCWLSSYGLSLVAVAAAALAAGCGDNSTVDESVASAGRTRTYYIAADELVWDYAPSGMNLITGMPFDDVANVFVQNGPDRIGRRYLKALYREYTDATFTSLKGRAPGWEHLGVLGPLVRATVGDTIEFHFKNNTTRPLSVHPHGVLYNKANEGAPYADGTPADQQNDDAVPPGESYDYKFQVPERAGPGPADGSSKLWMYHSHTDEVADTYAGLHGPIIITARGKARSDGTPFDVDRELVTNFEVLNENASPYIQQNIDMFAGDPSLITDLEDEDFVESNLMHSVNGYMFGNLPGLTTRKGQRVRWYVMAMGTEVDLHTPHWHGNTLLVHGSRTDVVELLPASMLEGDMVPDAAGKWLYHCHVNDHISAGMLALYTVQQ
jgi:FtsP/CotA-like multicopper oxidase with cupredoxin domain